MEPFGSEREDQDSLAPIQLDVSVDDEVASMKRGKGIQLLAIAVFALGTVSAGVLVVRRLDRERGYEQTSAAVQQMQRTHVTAFEQCALPLAQASSFVSSERLYAAFADMIERSAANYGRVLQLCEPKVASLPLELAEIRAPKDLQGPWSRLQASAVQLQVAVATLRAALTDPDKRDDYVAVTAHADHLAKALFAYDDRNLDLTHAIDAKR